MSSVNMTDKTRNKLPEPNIVYFIRLRKGMSFLNVTHRSPKRISNKPATPAFAIAQSIRPAPLRSAGHTPCGKRP